MFPDLSAWFGRFIVRLQTPRRLTSSAVRMAYAVAVFTDLAQLLLGPFGWVGADEVLDVGAAYLISRLVGFHPFLLPTFVLEFVPFTEHAANVDRLRRAGHQVTQPTRTRRGRASRFDAGDRREGEAGRLDAASRRHNE